MLYSNVIMNKGKSYTGFATGSVTAQEFEVGIFCMVGWCIATKL